MQLPTNSNAQLGNKNWGLGPSFVVLHLEHGNPWVYGALVNNIWSVTSSKQGGSYNNGLVQPFVNYNFEGGVYLTSAPILTVDWNAESGQKWVVPISGGIGKIFHFGRLAGEHAALGLLQRRAARLRRELADPRASAAHVPEIVCRSASVDRLGHLTGIAGCGPHHHIRERLSLADCPEPKGGDKLVRPVRLLAFRNRCATRAVACATVARLCARAM